VSVTRYWHEVAGHNFRLTNLQAAIGCGQLEHVDKIIAERSRIYRRYCALLGSMRGVSMQEIQQNVLPVMWAVAIRLDGSVFPQGRDQVMAQMSTVGIETRPGFYPASAMHHLYGPQVLPVCDEVGQSVLVLPSSPSLANDDIERVCDALESFAC
jgi:perosamine synthetase